MRRLCARVMVALCLLGACEQYDVPGRSDALPTCCGGAGRCVPAAFTPPDLGQRLTADSCDRGMLCAPRALVDDLGAALVGEGKLEACRAPGDLEGRCLPSCLPEVSAQGQRLTQASCAEAELCVPCFDPTSGADSGACRIGADRPREPARRFDRCCGSAGAELGTCLPLALLSAEQADALPVDSCPTAETRCAPSELTRAPYQLSLCTVQLVGSVVWEGGCLPACFVPPLARLFTPRGSCGASGRCVPCASLGPAQPGCE